MSMAITLFFSYAQDDWELLELLEKHLEQLKREGLIKGWHDRKIVAGSSKFQAVDQHIKNANIILLLVSPDFLSSDYCYEVEMQIALERYKSQEAQVIPVILRPCDWQSSLFGDLKTLPSNGQPVTLWQNQDAAFLDITQGIRKAVNQFQNFSNETNELLDQQEEPRNPYKGLNAFDINDAKDFFGRKDLIRTMLDTIKNMLIAEQLEQSTARFLAIIGPSGSGKSSAARAGLIPRLQEGSVCEGSENWIYLLPVKPAKDPIEELALSLSPHLPDKSLKSIREDLEDHRVHGLHLIARLIARDLGTKVVLVIDQFEELFVLTESEDIRHQFIDLLLYASCEVNGPLIVVITMRADFYDRPMRYPQLSQLIQHNQVQVLPMSNDDLLEAIKEPAALPDVNIIFEDNLIDTFLLDMQEQQDALPLLQFTLEQLFEHRVNRQVTLHAYRELGGVKGALLKQAENTYNALSKNQQPLARLLFLRLVELGRFDQEAVRCRVSFAELELEDPIRNNLLESTIDLFIKARLLTASRGEVHVSNQGNADKRMLEISHEALINEWPRLSMWLREAHDDVIFRQSFSRDISQWEQQGRPKNRLYQGSQLKEVKKWSSHNILSKSERIFLQASIQRQKQLYLATVAIFLLFITMAGFILFILNQYFSMQPYRLVISSKLLKPEQCVGGVGFSQCTVTLQEPANVKGTIHWKANSANNNHIIFSPSSGLLNPGESVKITITGIPCNSDAFSFSDVDGTSLVSTIWSCSPPPANLTAKYFSFRIHIDDVNAFLHSSPQAVDKVKAQIRSFILPHHRDVALVVGYAGASTPEEINQYNFVVTNIYTSFNQLGAEDEVFNHIVFYNAFFRADIPSNECDIDVYFYNTYHGIKV